jgi:ABC-type branched-subunit amino acid transport system permease subunit
MVKQMYLISLTLQIIGVIYLVFFNLTPIFTGFFTLSFIMLMTIPIIKNNCKHTKKHFDIPTNTYVCDICGKRNV